MQREPFAYLWDVHTAMTHVQAFTLNADLEQYRSNVMLHSAVERQLQNAGEALTQLKKLNPALAEQVTDCRAVIGFRNVLVHGYGQLDHAVVWRSIEVDVPRLKAIVAELLANTAPPDTP